MSLCPICQHAKRQAIDAAVASGRRIGVVAQQFRVEKRDLVKHFQHDPIMKVDERLALAGSRPGRYAMTSADEISSREASDVSADVVIDTDARVIWFPAHPINEPIMLDDAAVQRGAEQAFRETWKQMDLTHRQRNLAWLNEQLQSDDMGLP